ncbi:MAG: hypothetical protein AB1442_04670 [Nitrospirota bacterium]
MPGGMWDTKNFIMNAQIRKDGKLLKEIPLKYAGQPSSFSATLDIHERGSYEVTASAFEHRNGNTGLATIAFVVD